MWKWSDLKRILRKSDEISSSACIMWPVAATVPGVDEPHVTAIYLGDVANLNKEDILEAMLSVPFSHDAMLWACVQGLEWFGPEKDIPVLTVEHTYLHKYRDAVEAELNKRGIVNGSEYKDYKPHMTISDIVVSTGWEGSYLLTEPELWWGREHIRVRT